MRFWQMRFGRLGALVLIVVVAVAALWALESGAAGAQSGGSGFVETLSAGGYHTCAVTSAGAVQCWGGDEEGQSSPSAGRFTQVSAGGFHSCGLTASGAVECWGRNDEGQSSPPAGRFTQVSAGAYHGCGLTESGTIECWGSQTFFEGGYVGQSSPPAGRFTQVSAGGWHSCGLTASGAVECWGRNDEGQSSPPAGRFTQVSTGAYHGCGLTESGTIECWGSQTFFRGGYLGQSSPPAGRFTQVSAGAYHGCGLTKSGAVECWAGHDEGQSSPLAGRFTQVSSGGLHSCGLTASGAVQCWAYDEHGQSSPPAGLRVMQGGASQPQDEQYQLTTQVSPSGGGSVSGGGSYDAGAQATLRARANEGYEFSHWLIRETIGGDQKSRRATGNPLSLTVGGAVSATAVFVDECGTTSLGALGGSHLEQEGNWSGDECRASAGSGHADSYLLTLVETTDVTIYLLSDDADAHLLLYDSADRVIAYNDAGRRYAPNARRTDARITQHRLAPGEYRIEAATGAQNERGAYYLLVTDQAPSSTQTTIAGVSDLQRRAELWSAVADADRFYATLFRDPRILVDAEVYIGPNDIASAEDELKAAGLDTSDDFLDFGPTTVGRARRTERAGRFISQGVFGDTSGPDTISTLAHEMYHMIQFNLAEYEGAWNLFDFDTRGNLYNPFTYGAKWLVEGSATYFEALFGGDRLNRSVQETVENDLVFLANYYVASQCARAPRLNELETGSPSDACENDDKAGEGARLAYDMGALAIHLLIAANGGASDVAAFNDYWLARKDTSYLQGWRAVFESAFGLSVGEFYVKFEDWRRRGYPLDAMPSLIERESVTVRIAAQRLSNGRIEFALQPEGAELILPRSRMFPSNARVDRWLNSSQIEYDGRTLGRISAQRLSNGQVEFSFLPADGGERILPRLRRFPAGSGTTGWLKSSAFEVP